MIQRAKRAQRVCSMSTGASGLRPRQRQLVDAVAERGEQRRQQRERADDGDSDHQAGREAERRHERDAGDRERADGDDDGRAGEQHRAAGGRDRARDRLVRLHPARERVAVRRDDEERVVDPDAEAEHDRERRRGRRHLGHVTEQRDAGQADDDADQRGQNRQPHRDERAEREGEHDQRHREADDLAALRLGLRQLRAERTAGRGSEAGVLGGVRVVEDPLRVVDRDVAE
jgi:hypothetical protein